MQRLKSIWNASPFSWQGLKARWRSLLMTALALLVVFGGVYAFRFRTAPGETEENVFATLAAEQQGQLGLMEVALRLERLKTLVQDREMSSAISLYNSLIQNLEASAGTVRWTELEPQFDDLSSQLGRGDLEAVATIDAIIAGLRP